MGESSDISSADEGEQEERAVGEIIDILAEDLNRLRKRILLSAKRGTFTDNDAANARAFVRAFFAFVEGTCNALKVQALGDLLDDDELDVEPGTVDIVFEQRYDLDDHGEIVVKPLVYSLQKNVKFAFRLYSVASRRSNPLDTSASWWAALLEMSKVRDRFMHPKKPVDLDVAPHDVCRCVEAMHGFWSAVRRMVGIGESRGSNLHISHS